MNPLRHHPTVRLIARFAGAWPEIIRPGSEFSGYALLPTALTVPDSRVVYLPMLDREVERVAFLEIDPLPLDPDGRRFLLLLAEGNVMEVKAGGSSLVAKPANIANATELLSAFARLEEFVELSGWSWVLGVRALVKFLQNRAGASLAVPA